MASLVALLYYCFYLCTHSAYRYVQQYTNFSVQTVSRIQYTIFEIFYILNRKIFPYIQLRSIWKIILARGISERIFPELSRWIRKYFFSKPSNVNKQQWLCVYAPHYYRYLLVLCSRQLLVVVPLLLLVVVAPFHPHGNYSTQDSFYTLFKYNQTGLLICTFYMIICKICIRSIQNTMHRHTNQPESYIGSYII